MFKVGRVPLALFAAFAIAALPLGYGAHPVHAGNSSTHSHINCAANATECTEVYDSEAVFGEGVYVGHDEPSLLFYSPTPGSGNSDTYRLTLPKDPPVQPKQDGTGGTFNFQLRPAFWFGMAMCDSQSAPLPGTPCTADTDANIFNSTNPASAKYIGKHPGSAFMEMQFYPPGWVAWPPGNSCDATKWCAALNIDSLSENMNTGRFNNTTCRNLVGDEYVNFAFITKNGVAQAPANPVDSTGATFTPDPTKDLFMSSGDTLTVDLHDTSAGFQVVINDLTTGQSGLMTASAANSFGQVQFDPTGTSCHNIPYNFHPMYSTSSPDTRVPWAAHSYNIAYSDEIGHFEYCNAVSSEGGNCTSAGVNDPSGLDSDDNYCFDAAASLSVPTTGCFSIFSGGENDFDGPEYQHNWPGSNPNPTADAQVHATPVTFTSPLFTGPGNSGLRNYKQAAFENDLPRIEGTDFSPNNNCQRHVSNPADPNPGSGCVDPPNGASFYPIYSTASVNGSCAWEEGDAHLPNATNTFGGTPTAEYGELLLLSYPAAGNTITQRFNDFHSTLGNNPCPAPGGQGG